MKENQGTVRRQVSEFVIADSNVRNIITHALRENGYDIELKPIFQESTHVYIGDEFKVFAKE